jgi:hypothetical protein
MKKDKEDVIEAVKNLSSSFEAASVKMNTFDKFDHEFMNERDFVLKIVQLNGILLERASNELQDDGEIVLESVKNSNSLQYASDILKNDEEIALESIKNFPESFCDFGEKLNNKEFLFKALKVNPLILSETIIENMEILLMVSKWHKLIKEKTFNFNFKFE